MASINNKGMTERSNMEFSEIVYQYNGFVSLNDLLLLIIDCLPTKTL